MAEAVLTINSRNYGAWSLRGWLLCRLAGLDFTLETVGNTDPGARAELLQLSPSFLIPRLTHGELVVWDTLAIAEYLNELAPERNLFPAEPAERALCRSVSGEIHAGFANLRASLPMNVKSRHPGFPVWTGAQADIDRIEHIFSELLARSGGPFLFGAAPTVADAMYAPVCTRFRTYDIKLGEPAAAYCDAILALPEVVEWSEAAAEEHDDVEELEMEF